VSCGLAASASDVRHSPHTKRWIVRIQNILFEFQLGATENQPDNNRP
jgi:hypothetical protein